ncbi:MAG TPA: ATP-dependent DNA helicase RecG [Candidatus Omnitrophica bacterium]|nr:ATP-dependent DNA helicase RecG [Candidatus Omnitrophota bacterium]
MQEINKVLQDIRYLKGVGPKRAKFLARLGIRSIRDLLYFFPRKYQDRRLIKKISTLTPGEKVLIKGKVIVTSLKRSQKGMPIFEAVIDDGSGIVLATWFNQPYLKDVIHKSQELLLYGKVDYYQGLRILSPEYELVEKENQVTGILPIYTVSGNLTQKFMRSMMRKVLDDYAHLLGEFLPYEIRQRQGLLNRIVALRNIHFPESEQLLYQAQKRFAFEEVFLLQLVIGRKRLKRKFFIQGISYSSNKELRQAFKKVLPFELTSDQEKVMMQIEKDMASPRPMNRLLQGEVGTGKTIIASYACLIAGKNGYQSAIMVPTEILAHQQYIKIAEILSRFGVEVGILISGMDKKYRQEMLEKLKSGEIDVIVGTHALIQEEVEFNKLGLVVIDEQHKFGVKQRELLKQKGKVPDCLYMTATPIPRTLALTLFGDLDISTMKEYPKGEKNVFTYWVSEDRRKDVYQFLKEMVNNSAWAFVVCPRIEEHPQEKVRNVNEVFWEVCSLVGREKVALLHGGMSSGEKNKVISEFQEGKKKVLVTTIVIEVGIDVPDASVMIIESADRFGLSQLHQLRGRIGRAGQPSYCILIADPKTLEGRRRLQAVVWEEEGFKISEQDLEIRGAGELLGEKQHGFIDIKLRDVNRQIQLLNIARDEAFKLLKKDPHLKSKINIYLKEELQLRFSELEF